MGLALQPARLAERKSRPGKEGLIPHNFSSHPPHPQEREREYHL